MAQNIIPVRCLGTRILVDISDRGEFKTNGGIIIRDDDFKEHGVRPREALVLAVGPEGLKDGILPGQTILLEHGGWTRNNGMKVLGRDGINHRVWMTEPQFVYGIVKEAE